MLSFTPVALLGAPLGLSDRYEQHMATMQPSNMDSVDVDAFSWREQCLPRHTTTCCRAWKAKVKKSEELLRLQLDQVPAWLTAVHTPGSSLFDAATSIVAYDLFEPTWICEAAERLPPKFEVGNGDGPKWVCGVDALATLPDCLVYSLGSNGDTSFESGIKQRAPRCEIHTFDPTLDKPWQLESVHAAEAAGWLRFHAVGISDVDGTFAIQDRTFPALSLPSLKRSLSHGTGRHLDLLKVDVEGAEHRMLASAEARAELAHVGQLQVELHGHSFNQTLQFMQAAHAAGLRLFSKEPNHWGCAGSGCVEMSFVSAAHAFRSFVNTHPSCTESDESEQREPMEAEEQEGRIKDEGGAT